MKKNILVICDSDERYLNRLDGFLRNSLRIPFEIVGFTTTANLSGFTGKEDSLLIISDTMLDKSVAKDFKNILVLDESPTHFNEDEAIFGADDGHNIKHTSKFQSSEQIAESVIDMCLKVPELSAAGIRKPNKHKMRIIGFYTPNRDVCQTDISFEFANALAKKEKVLFFTNDAYCPDIDFRCLSENDNLSDIMYYARCDNNRFGFYLEKAVKKKRSVRILPSPYISIIDCTGADYIKLLRKIEESGIFETVVMDLYDPFANMFQVFKMCDAIISLTTDMLDFRMKIFSGDMFLEEQYGMPELVVSEATDGKELAAGYIRKRRPARRQKDSNES